MLGTDGRWQLGRTEVALWSTNTAQRECCIGPATGPSFPYAALVVVAESNAGLASELLDRLRDAGLRVHWECDGARTLTFAESHPVDLVVLGADIPDMDTASLCRRLHERSPVALITLSRHRDRIVRHLNDGADDCLVVPYECAELTARIRAILWRRGRWTDTLRVGRLHIAGQRALAFAGGHIVHLTPQELALLNVLASHPGRLMTRSQLASFGRGGSGGAFRTTDALVNRLRRKLQLPVDSPGPDEVWIETVYGVGYALRWSGDRGEAGRRGPT
jgi:DNA-binding response OmpR family regulator